MNKINKQIKHSLDIPSERPEKWMIGVKSLELYNTVYNIKQSNIILQIFSTYKQLTELEFQFSLVTTLENIRTRRERLKSALYLRLNMRKRLFKKKLEIFEKRNFQKMSHSAEKCKRGALWALLTYILLQNIKKLERGTPLRH